MTGDTGDMIHLHGVKGMILSLVMIMKPRDMLTIMGGDGNDYIRAYGGDNMIFGGGGDDIFVVDTFAQDMVIYGDDSSGNISYGDTVLLNWEFDAENVAISGDVHYYQYE